MPIEVRELVIRARIDDTPDAGDDTRTRITGSSGGLTERDVQRIVSLCVEKVMQVIKRQKER